MAIDCAWTHSSTTPCRPLMVEKVWNKFALLSRGGGAGSFSERLSAGGGGAGSGGARVGAGSIVWVLLGTYAADTRAVQRYMGHS